MFDLAAHAPAVVVGICAHGLAIARALHRVGVRVHALEADPTRSGAQTLCASVHIVDDINSAGLIDALLAFAPKVGGQGKPVLFLTNDRMVETVGRHVDVIEAHYRLSWGHAAATLLPLLHKHHIETRCQEVGISYPRTVLIDDLDRIAKQVEGLRFPVIAKPTRPVSAFKTIVAESLSALEAERARLALSMPVIVQEFIPGDDTAIRFGALFLDHGRVVARFEGRKLRSRPMGHTTVAVSVPCDEIHALAIRFFEGLNLSGPVSLEVKQDTDGSWFVIEPTVGRTDFWVGLCIANGIDLPVIEYRTGLGLPVPEAKQGDSKLWINGERDPAALLWLLRHHPAMLLGRGIRGVYLDASDLAPFSLMFRRRLKRIPGQLSRTLRRIRPVG